MFRVSRMTNYKTACIPGIGALRLARLEPIRSESILKDMQTHDLADETHLSDSIAHRDTRLVRLVQLELSRF